MVPYSLQQLSLPLSFFSNFFSSQGPLGFWLRLQVETCNVPILCREDHISTERQVQYARFRVIILDLTLVGSCLRRTMEYRFSVADIALMELMLL